MAVAVKFRAPYIFHRGSALEVHAGRGLLKCLCFSLSNTGRLPKEKLNERGFNIINITLKIKISHFKN